MPLELEQARYVLEACERYRCLPWPGSLMQQPSRFLRLQEIVRLGTPRIERGPESDAEHN